MADRPPPSRYSVVERGGRLVVIDRDTGSTPPSAAERMAEHDRRMGHDQVRSAPRDIHEDAPAGPPKPAAAKPAAAKPAAPALIPSDRMAASVAAMNDRRPWAGSAKPAAPKPSAPQPAAPRPDAAAIAPQRPRPTDAGTSASYGRKTIVTGKWWDAKGPRAIELGAKGQQVLSGGFVTLFFITVAAAIVLLLVSPVVLFFAAFLIFRFGGRILGPIGAGIVDKAIAERN